MIFIKSIFQSFIAFYIFYSLPKFSKNFETISVNIHFQLCLAAESIGQDSAILPDDQPIKLRETSHIIIAKYQC